MKTETVQFVQEMADIAITCFMQNQRVTFWGYCPEVLINLARGGLLPRMPFQVVDDRAACQGKPVFAAEYTDLPGDFNSFCEKSKQLNFSTILKKRGLDAWIQTCP